MSSSRPAVSTPARNRLSVMARVRRVAVTDERRGRSTGLSEHGRASAGLDSRSVRLDDVPGRGVVPLGIRVGPQRSCPAPYATTVIATRHSRTAGAKSRSKIIGSALSDVTARSSQPAVSARGSRAMRAGEEVTRERGPMSPGEITCRRLSPSISIFILIIERISRRSVITDS